MVGAGRGGGGRAADRRGGGTVRRGRHPDADPECPATLDCDFVPAAYAQNDPADPSNYGNYDTANRPADGLRIDHIVLHDTEGTYAAAIRQFTTPTSFTSSHYVVRAADGHVTQLVRTRDVAWQAGNWYLNTHSIGIEVEGLAVGGAGYTEAEYQATARLVRWLAAKYDVPVDRQHVLGHDNVAGDTAAKVARMHWDPGPLVSDPALHPDGKPGTACADDWGDKASTGTELAVAGRQGGWTAVWWGGVKAWFLDRDASVPTRSARVTPKPGVASVQVYGRAYPEEGAYAGSPVPVQALAPLQYTIGSGQAYTTAGVVRTDYYHAKTIDSSLPGDHTIVVGRDRYYQIQLNHRLGYVRAADVDVLP